MDRPTIEENKKERLIESYDKLDELVSSLSFQLDNVSLEDEEFRQLEDLISRINVDLHNLYEEIHLS